MVKFDTTNHVDMSTSGHVSVLLFCSCLVAKSCLTFLRLQGFLCPQDFPGKNSGVVAISLSRGSSDSGIEPASPAWQVGSLPPESSLGWKLSHFQH